MQDSVRFKAYRLACSRRGAELGICLCINRKCRDYKKHKALVEENVWIIMRSFLRSRPLVRLDELGPSEGYVPKSVISSNDRGITFSDIKEEYSPSPTDEELTEIEHEEEEMEDNDTGYLYRRLSDGRPS